MPGRSACVGWVGFCWKVENWLEKFPISDPCCVRVHIKCHIGCLWGRLILMSVVGILSGICVFCYRQIHGRDTEREPERAETQLAERKSESRDRCSIEFYESRPNCNELSNVLKCSARSTGKKLYLLTLYVVKQQRNISRRRNARVQTAILARDTHNGNLTQPLLNLISIYALSGLVSCRRTFFGSWIWQRKFVCRAYTHTFVFGRNSNCRSDFLLPKLTERVVLYMQSPISVRRNNNYSVELWPHDVH